MSADYEYFQRIPFEEYVEKRDDINKHIKLSDLEHGMIVDAYSINRHLIRDGSAVKFIAELQLNDTLEPSMGAVSLNLLIYSHTSLKPIEGAQYPTKATVVPQEDENGPLLWQMTGQFPLRTARYGVIQAGFFNYWADSLISELEIKPFPPQIEK